MIIIRFPNPETKGRALGYLAGRFDFKSWATGEILVSETVLPHLAAEGIEFTSEGPATYDRILSSLRDPSAAGIQ